jgi:hypothetical protein
MPTASYAHSPRTRHHTKPQFPKKFFAMPRAALRLKPSHSGDYATVRTARREGNIPAAKTTLENFVGTEIY